MSTDVIIRVKAFDDASPALKQAVNNLKSFDNVAKTVGTNASTSARGVTTLGRGFLYAAGQAGPLNSEMGVLSQASSSVGLASAGAAIGVGLLAAGLAKTVQSAIGFESAITRVAKTAGLSTQETKQFGDAILDMSRRLPIATGDLTKIGEVAGQLGISGVANIANFTEEVAKLSSTTGVSADVLATSLGTLAQVSGLPIKDISRLSSAITELGNTSNSTESQILDFSTRLVGVATALNIPLIAVTGISSAFAAAGVDAEAGSTAIQRLFIGISEAAQKGGDELQLFANVAGKTADEFRDLANSNPAEAFTQFIEGLRGVPNAIQVLDALGLADARLIRAVESVANSQEPLRKSIDTANRAALENTATNIEFARSAETTAAKIQILKNNISAAGVEIGTAFLPAVNAALDGLIALSDVDVSGGIQELKNNLQGLSDALTVVHDNADTAFSILSAVPQVGPVLALAGAYSQLADAIGSIPHPDFSAADLLDFVPGPLGAIVKLATHDFTGKSGADERNKALSDRTDATDLLGINKGINLRNAQEAAKAAGRTIPIPPGLTGGGGGGGGGAHQLTALEAAMDGVITRTEALTLGLSDQQVITLELAVAGNKQADADFRRRIELQTLAQVFPGLTSQEVQFRLGLAAIAEHLAATGESIQKFILDTSTAALNGFKSAFDAIFSRPTKESAGLQLQLDEAKRKKLLAPGASDAQNKKFDADIKRIQDLINVRSNAVDILKDKAILADQTLLSDADALNQAGLQISAIGQESVRTAQAIGQVFLNTLAQMGGGAAAPALSLPDALRALAALPDHGQSLLPSFAVGTDFVPRDMTARIHRGERIIPAGGESGQTMNFTTYITADSTASDESMRKLARMVREEQEAAQRRAGFRGSYVTSGAYTPS